MSFWRFTRLKFLFPFILFVLMFADGASYSAFSGILNLAAFQFIPMLFLSWIAFVTMFNDDDNIHFYIWLLVAGLVFGLYNIDSSGIYIYPIGFLVFGLIVKFFSRPSSGVLYNLFIFLVALMVYLYLTYGLGSLINLTTTNFFEQSLYIILPTVLLNAILFAILYFPIQRLIIWSDEGRIDSPYRGI